MLEYLVYSSSYGEEGSVKLKSPSSVARCFIHICSHSSVFHSFLGTKPPSSSGSIVALSVASGEHSPCWRIWRRGSCAAIGWRRCSGQRADCRGRSEHPPRGSGNRSALTPLGRSSLGKANSAAKWGVSVCFQLSESQSDACFGFRYFGLDHT